MDYVSRSALRKPSRVVMFCAGALALIIALELGVSQNPPSTGPSAAEIIQFLTKTIDWYRQTAVEQQIATEPADLMFAADNRRMADQIVRLSFEFARQAADAESKQSKATPAQNTAPASQYQSLMQATGSADQLVQQTQAELDSLKQKLASAPQSKRAAMQSTVAELESELALFKARSDALHGMLEFVSGTSSNGLGASGLRAQVEELARSVPGALSEPPGKNASDQAPAQPPTTATVPLNKPNPSGIWGLTSDLFRLSRKRRVLKQELAATDALEQSSNQIRTPLVNRLKQMIDAGNTLANQADTSDPKQLVQEKQQLDALTTQFKQVSAELLPVSKQAVLLGLYKRSLTNWQDETRSDYREDLRNLLLRLIFLAVLVGGVLAVGEVWRRTIYRYVQDVRRRYQFLLLRRIVLWIAVLSILVFTFASELGSVVTFAGLITAGVAVALQNVIVSIVGYFFLIGKYGIKVGDRVEVTGVTGEVVDIGLVRFHLMELGNRETDSPTGRVVAFSNSIVFQSTAGLFKQIPGTNFIWHEIHLTFALENDYREVRQRVNQAVEAAYAQYKDHLERQRRQMEMSLSSISAAELKPRARMHFAPSGIEVVIRFPVVLNKAEEIDERLIAELFNAVEREPKLKLVGSEIPTVKTSA